MKIINSRPVPTHILSGFLGAGKTTLLQHLLQQQPEHEVWAVLMNEFGQIGVDQQLLPQVWEAECIAYCVKHSRVPFGNGAGSLPATKPYERGRRLSTVNGKSSTLPPAASIF